MTNSHKRVAYDTFKRVLDILASIVVIAITLPIQAIVAILVLIKLGRPILFRHPRPGKDEKVFTMVKFRSMVNADPENGLVDDEQRLTRFGLTLRSTSLDELPSLFHVLMGQMSIVGPRPLNVRYLPRYSAEQARRHEVRPGITGLAQVNGRNAISWPDKLALDVRYVDSRSFRLDAWIVLRTVALVLRRDGVSAEGHATAHEFLG